MADPTIRIRLEDVAQSGQKAPAPTPSAQPEPTPASAQQPPAPAGAAPSPPSPGPSQQQVEALARQWQQMQRQYQELAKVFGPDPAQARATGADYAAEIDARKREAFARAGTVGQQQLGGQAQWMWPTIARAVFGQRGEMIGRGVADLLKKDQYFGAAQTRTMGGTAQALPEDAAAREAVPIAQGFAAPGEAVGTAEAAGAAGGGAAAALGPAAAIALAVQNIKSGLEKAASRPNDATTITSGMSQIGGGPIIGPIIGKIMDTVSSAVGTLVRAPGTIAQRAGDVVGSAARGDNAEAVGKLYTGMVDLAENVPLVGAQLKLLGDTAGKVVGAFTGVVNAFVERGRELRGYSGDLAQSYAISDVREMLADIQEAQTLGPELARLNDIQTDMSLMLRDLLRPIKEWLIRNLADFLEWLKPKLELLPDLPHNLMVIGQQIVHNMIASLEAGINAVIAAIPGTGNARVNLPNVIVEALRRHKFENDPWDEKLLNIFRAGLVEQIERLQGMAEPGVVDPAFPGLAPPIIAGGL